MNIYWRIHLHPSVFKYLIGLRESGFEIREAIRQLASNGLPPEAQEMRLLPGHYVWVDARHWITCRVLEEEHAIHVTHVESVEVN